MAAERYESELGDLFDLATEFVRGLRDLKNEKKLKFYGLFKQVSFLRSSLFVHFFGTKLIIVL